MQCDTDAFKMLLVLSLACPALHCSLWTHLELMNICEKLSYDYAEYHAKDHEEVKYPTYPYSFQRHTVNKIATLSVLRITSNTSLLRTIHSWH